MIAFAFVVVVVAWTNAAQTAATAQSTRRCRRHDERELEIDATVFGIQLDQSGACSKGWPPALLCVHS